jgi:hypothetical protein
MMDDVPRPVKSVLDWTGQRGAHECHAGRDNDGNACRGLQRDRAPAAVCHGEAHVGHRRIDLDFRLAQMLDVAVMLESRSSRGQDRG